MNKHTPELIQPQLPLDEIPYGYCHCGCGLKTKIAKRTDSKRGVFKGQPNDYIAGHQNLKRTMMPDPNPSGLCMCGCGQPVPLAKCTSIKTGLVKDKPGRYIRGHFARRNAAEKRFWKYVNKHGPIYPVLNTHCWLWEGGLTTTGYGRISVDGTYVAAHRFSYELHYGPISNGLFICHHCDRPACIRPEHLFPGTHQDNMDDQHEKGRQLRGEGISWSRLTEKNVIEIRLLWKNGMTQAAIAEKFSVSQGAINCIVRYKTWKHVP